MLVGAARAFPSRVINIIEKRDSTLRMAEGPEQGLLNNTGDRLKHRRKC
jgi:hypothetical protein